MFSSILEYVGNVTTTCKRCGACDIPFRKIDPKETFSYYIGGHHVEVEASIMKGECPRCNKRWESPLARQYRNGAFQQAVDNFWRERVASAGVSQGELSSVMLLVSRIMAKLGGDKKRQVAAELGRWLANCAFLEGV